MTLQKIQFLDVWIQLCKTLLRNFSILGVADSASFGKVLRSGVGGMKETGEIETSGQVSPH